MVLIKNKMLLENVLLFLSLQTCIFTIVYSCNIVNDKMNCANYGFTTLQDFTTFNEGLTVINMERGKLEMLGPHAYGNISTLKDIRLDKNNLHTLSEKAFYGLPQLKEVNLDFNNLTSLPDHLFEPSARMEGGVRINDNHITEVPIGIIRHMKGNLFMFRNPFQCDCLSVIPKEKKNNIRGSCANLGDKSVSLITYKDVDCEVCLNFDCGINGACKQISNITTKIPTCHCFYGFSGEKCERRIIRNNDKKIQPPRNETTTFSDINFVGKLKITQKLVAKDISVLIQGCSFGTKDKLRDFKLQWLKDGFAQETLNSSFLEENLKNTQIYSLKDLKLSLLASNVGSYECRILQNGFNNTKISNQVYLYLKDTSETLIKTRLASQNTSRLREILINRVELIYKTFVAKDKWYETKTKTTQSLGFNLSAGNGQVEGTAKLLITGLSKAEKLRQCISMKKIISTSTFEPGTIVINRDCCLGNDFWHANIKDALVGDTSHYPCQDNEEQGEIKCTFDEITGTRWKIVHRCKPINHRLKELTTITYCNNTSTIQQTNCSSVETVAKELRNITSITLTYPTEISYVSTVIDNIVKYENLNQQNLTLIGSDIMETASNVLENNIQIIATSEKKYQSSTQMTRSLETFAYIYADSQETSKLKVVEISKPNLAMKIQRTKDNNNDIYVTTGQKQTNFTNVQISGVKPNESEAGLISRMIKIPKENFENLTKNVVVAFSYRKSYYFLSLDGIDGSRLNANKNVEVDGLIISASLGNKDYNRLSFPIELIFKKTSNKDGNANCMFWDYEKETKFSKVYGGWSDRGCRKLDSSTNTMIHCECNHLTNFALILNPDGHFNNPFVLSLISWIGCAISIAGLIFTIVIHLGIKSIRSTLATKILISLCFSLLAVLIIFLAAAEKTSSRNTCKGIAFLLHYFTLSTFGWMLVEGVNLYRNFVIVLATYGSNNKKAFRIYSLCAWGLPLIVVGFLFGFKQNEYGNDDICLVNGDSLYYGLLLPISITLAFNWIVLVIALRAMRKSNIATENSKRNNVNAEIWRIVLCSVILGLSWTFAVFAIGDAKDVFQWLFCVSTALQGFSIFMLFVIGNRDIRLKISEKLKTFESSNLDYYGVTSDGKQSRQTQHTISSL